MDIHEEHKAARVRSAILSLLYHDGPMIETVLVAAVRNADSYLADEPDGSILGAINEMIDLGLVDIAKNSSAVTAGWAADKSGQEDVVSRFLALTEKGRLTYEQA